MVFVLKKIKFEKKVVLFFKKVEFFFEEDFEFEEEEVCINGIVFGDSLYFIYLCLVFGF